MPECRRGSEELIGPHIQARKDERSMRKILASTLRMDATHLIPCTPMQFQRLRVHQPVRGSALASLPSRPSLRPSSIALNGDRHAVREHSLHHQQPVRVYKNAVHAFRSSHLGSACVDQCTHEEFAECLFPRVETASGPLFSMPSAPGSRCAQRSPARGASCASPAPPGQLG